MSIRNLKDSSKKPWLCECYPNGRAGKRVRKRFTTKGEAAAFELFIMKQVDDKPWMGEKTDDRRLSQLIELWFTHYGATLANGSVIQSKFLKMADAMGNPIASTFTSKVYSTFRSQPMAGTIDFVDARWNEAAQLKGSQLSKFKVTFTNTKTKKNRSVPISEELYHEIFKPTSEKLFQECYTPFCYILKNKLGVTLPSGQASHVLRHTFASHFMMNGGNILVLRDILGHADISMTMRYAHFAPDHLTEAISHNPLSNLQPSPQNFFARLSPLCRHLPNFRQKKSRKKRPLTVRIFRSIVLLLFTEYVVLLLLYTDESRTLS
ncbi:integrase [Vibrio azureus]|uniref:Tyr recombinase domain-containing protein n=1 Tax=Vibrio azureus NBRC 104587 TaxID=1219077 RepID=U3CGR5_9VIBR|nr:integrase [Vibrio azureus]GAD77468.1 hypothetical protein VAZ01S_077_00050 [Vibrio azureus NBRC 104587]